MGLLYRNTGSHNISPLAGRVHFAKSGRAHRKWTTDGMDTLRSSSFFPALMTIGHWTGQKRVKSHWCLLIGPISDTIRDRVQSVREKMLECDDCRVAKADNYNEENVHAHTHISLHTNAHHLKNVYESRYPVFQGVSFRFVSSYRFWTGWIHFQYTWQHHKDTAKKLKISVSLLNETETFGGSLSKWRIQDRNVYYYY